LDVGERAKGLMGVGGWTGQKLHATGKPGRGEAGEKKWKGAAALSESHATFPV